MDNHPPPGSTEPRHTEERCQLGEHLVRVGIEQLEIRKDHQRHLVIEVSIGDLERASKARDQLARPVPLWRHAQYRPQRR